MAEEQVFCLLLTRRQPRMSGLCKGTPGILSAQGGLCSAVLCPTPYGPSWVPAQAHGGGSWSNSSCPHRDTIERDANESSCYLHAGLHLCWYQPGSAEADGVSQVDRQWAGSLQLCHSHQPMSPASGTHPWCNMRLLWLVQMFPLQNQHSSTQSSFRHSVLPCIHPQAC